jgi:hypothetical protein
MCSYVDDEKTTLQHLINAFRGKAWVVYKDIYLHLDLKIHKQKVRIERTGI